MVDHVYCFEEHVLSSKGNGGYFQLYMMTFRAQGLTVIFRGLRYMYQE